MQPVKDFKEFALILNGFKKTHDKEIETNCFFLPNEVSAYTDQQRLFYIKQDTALFFIVNEEYYYHLYYYIVRGICVEKNIPEKFEKPVTLDFVFRLSRMPEDLDGMLKRWRDAGFADYKQYMRLNRSIAAEDDSHIQNPDVEKSYRFGYEDTSLAGNIRKLWEESLDIYSTALHSVEGIAENLQAGNVFYLTDRVGELCASLYVTISGTTCIIQHVTVDKRYRGQGLGAYLLLKVLAQMKQRGLRNSYLWADEKNTSAIRLYEKCGYVHNAMISKQFIYKRG